jgi:hypothetical protein
MGRSSALIVALALLLAGCGSPGQSATITPTCAEVACTGVLNGASYEVLLPETWNGTLVIYAHGYRNAQPIPPDFAPVNVTPEPAPGWASGDRTVGELLLTQGYALAGSAFSANGWAVQEGVQANADLLDWFRQEIGEPTRVLAWGESLGGLITAVWSQGNAEVDGALLMCGALAGVLPNADLAITASALLASAAWPELPVTGFSRYEDALAAAVAATQVVVQLADIPMNALPSDLPVNELDLPLLEVPAIDPNPQLVLDMAAALGAPTVTRQFDGATSESRLLAAVESLVTAVTFGLLIRYELTERVGAEVAVIQSVSAPLPLPGGQPDENTRSAALALGEPSGDLVQPTIALHTIDDSVTIAANVDVFATRVAGQGRSDLLQTWFTVPPEVFPADPGAPYGAGHCNFSPSVKAAALEQLADWVDTGEPPPVSDDLLGPASGLEVSARAPAWPLPLLP